MTTPVDTPAPPAVQGYDEQDHKAGRFYGNFELNVLLFTEEVESICNRSSEPIVSARVFHRHDGSVELKVNAREMRVLLYRSSLDAPEFIDETCSALLDGDAEDVLLWENRPRLTPPRPDVAVCDRGCAPLPTPAAEVTRVRRHHCHRPRSRTIVVWHRHQRHDRPRCVVDPPADRRGHRNRVPIRTAGNGRERMPGPHFHRIEGGG